MLRQLWESKELFFNESITKAEDERTDMAKKDFTKAQCVAIDAAHKNNKEEIRVCQQGCNIVHSISSGLQQTMKGIVGTKQVWIS